MKKSKLFNFEGISNLSSIVGGATQTCYGNQCDIQIGDGNSCWNDDVKITDCDPNVGSDTAESISGGSTNPKVTIKR